MNLDTSYFERCIDTLEKAYLLLKQSNKDIIEYDMYRSACIKEFEIIIELSGKLLKKVLVPYFHSTRAVDELYFKDVFRQAALHNIISDNSCEKWLLYRDNRNSTAHDYGVGFAEGTLNLLPQFIIDSKELALALKIEDEKNVN
ncbi:MAG: HI0074 family nucleotidyltransferase substrate-binding subunit [Candidatus Kapabacteria bacterium]|nr:HI0074 family nucleotidyltransferase substrate-binding subunit [Candidatus Kapabacteria bacterium]